MAYWLSSITYLRFQADQAYDFAVDGYGEEEFHRVLKIEPGDRLVYYIKRLGLFAALAEARGRCYVDWSRLWPDAAYPVRFERRPLLVLPRTQMVPARPLLPRLSLSQLVGFSLRELSQADFELIEQEMRRLGGGHLA